MALTRPGSWLGSEARGDLVPLWAQETHSCVPDAACCSLPTTQASLLLGTQLRGMTPGSGHPWGPWRARCGRSGSREHQVRAQASPCPCRPTIGVFTSLGLYSHGSGTVLGLEILLNFILCEESHDSRRFGNLFMVVCCGGQRTAL